jgi:hypothetical protein
MSVKEVVDTILKKPAFGEEFYKVPSNDMLLKKIPFGHSNKVKFSTFLDQIQT